MRRIVIASHHRFAAGLRDTLEFIGGDQLGIVDINAYVDETSLDDQIAEVFAGFDPDDEVLVFTDMMQGSVNQAFQRYIGDKVFVVTGVNVPCALELAVAGGQLAYEDIARTVQSARDQLVFMNECISVVVEDDE